MPDHGSDVRATLDPGPHAARQARELLRSVVPIEGRLAAFERAELLVSEVVANAVLHGAPPVAVRVQWDGATGLVVTVSDGSPARPVRRDPAGFDDEGHGVQLVHTLSDAWGVDSTAAGKAVWFRLQEDGEACPLCGAGVVARPHERVPEVLLHVCPNGHGVVSHTGLQPAPAASGAAGTGGAPARA